MWAKLRKESGARLREERMRLKLSQEAFAERVGVHRRTQVNYEAGEREPDVAYYEAAASLGIDLPYVLEGDRIEKLPALAAKVAARLFGGDISPAGASVQALENLFYLFALDEVQSASQSGALSIGKAQAEALVRTAVEKSDEFEEAFDAICRYAGRLGSLSGSDLANLVFETLQRHGSAVFSGKHPRAR
ncbi:helix-turn-helix transcriptional regulator [Paraburkholderia sp. BL23I1N1]|uniref:helix-turn-helix domain-containing protein n=1 Tax=Paraburkholderia sp. BL23I1N1 TaxID=1938802 RepID=UPI0028778EA6|nr:helix-turn-helix transcriptional regulator [Paraburkholderia sp. BL23I1N1]